MKLNQSELTTMVYSWQRDPVLFVRQMFKAEPDAWQRDALEALVYNPRVAMSACKGPGKSCLLAWTIWWFMTTRANANVVCTSITADNLKDGLWKELAMWMAKQPLLGELFEFTAERIKSKVSPDIWWCSARSFPRAADESAQNATLAGLHGQYVMIVLDEVGDYPDGVMAAAEAIFANADGQKRLVVAGNPIRTDGPLFRISNNPRGWKLIKITGDPDDPKRSPRIDANWAREEIRKWGREHPWVMANILGEFPPASSDQLISSSQVRVCMERTMPERELSGAIIWGLDPARFGDDETCLIRRQGNMVHRPTIWRHFDGTRLGDLTMKQILEANDKGCGPDAIFVDVGGIGASVYDRLVALGWEDMVLPVDFGSSPTESRFANKRTEMWSDMAEWIKRSDSILPEDTTLAGELCAPKFKFKATGKQTKMILESKEDMRKAGNPSPNRADALALTFASTVFRKSDNDVANHYQHGVKALTEYNPLEV